MRCAILLVCVHNHCEQGESPMERISVPYHHDLQKVLDKLANPGLLLVATKRSGQANVMTIGWGTVGIIWGRPIFVVMVRPSRYTYEFIEESQAFTVNVPAERMRKWVGVCGTRSGRDIDKFAEYGIETSPCSTVESVTIDACPMVYECQVVHHNDVIAPNLAPEIEVGSYGGADYHRIYYGQILGAFAAPGA